MANRAADVLTEARKWLGYCRYDDPQTGTVFGRWYAANVAHDSSFAQNGVAYCAMFVSYCFAMVGARAACVPRAYCPYMEEDGWSHGRISKYDARPGDIVLFEWGDGPGADHTGIVEANLGNAGLQCLEGNTTGDDGRSGSVARRTRGWGVISMVIRPDYDDSAPAPTLPIDEDGWLGPLSVAAWQSQLGTPVDGVISGQWTGWASRLEHLVSATWEGTGSTMVKALQKKLGVDADGVLGPVSIKALQRFVGADSDGWLGPDTATKIQKAINAGKWKN